MKQVHQRPKLAMIGWALLAMASVSMARSARNKQPLDLFRVVDAIPFSFQYDGRPSSEFLTQWKKTESEEVLADGVRHKTITYSDPKGALEIVGEISRYPESHAAEWVLHIKNNGPKDSGIFEQ